MSKWRQWRWLLMIFKVIFSLACVVFLFTWLSVNWPVIQSVWLEINWLYVLGSFVLLSISFLFLPCGMVIFLSGRQDQPSYLQSARAYYSSQPAKYLPGGLWVYPTRLVMMKNMGFNLSTSTLALAFETISLVISSLFVSLVALGTAVDRMWSMEFRFLIGLVCLSVAIGWTILPELFHWTMKDTYRLPENLQRIRAIPIINRVRLLLVSVLMYSVMWSVAGLSFYVLTTAVSESISIESVSFTIGVSTLAWLAGFVSVFSPGGVGVREGTISVMLGTIMSPHYSMVVALSFRVLWSVAEVVFFVFSLFIGRNSNQHLTATLCKRE